MPSRLRPRHIGVLVSFLSLVIAPLLVTVWYLYAKAADQYASTVGFSVRREDLDSAFSMISGLASLSGSSSPDTDIIYRYIYSQELVTEVDHELDLRTIWNKAEGDFVFSLGDETTIEDLIDYWEDMVTVNYDSGTRLIEVRVLAFTPEDARTITALIFEKSTAMINRLNDIALEDSVRFTKTELEKARESLFLARSAITEFRNTYQIVDPAADVAAQMALVSSLEQRKANTKIELDLLLGATSPDDPRIRSLERQIRVIDEQIRFERQKLGIGSNSEGSVAIADLLSDYERLKIDQEFAEGFYQSARAAHEAALSEAQRQSRYLAAHMTPTLAESSRFPKRLIILTVVGVFLVMVWSIGVLLFYSLRDRR